MDHRKRLRKPAALGLAVGVAALALATGAIAATGNLTLKSCVDDNDTPASGTCATDADGLENANSVAVSADGGSVYATSSADDAVVRFNRKPNGAITPKGCIDDMDFGPDDCAKSAEGLDAPGGIAISPDGTSVYVAGPSDDAIVRFDRDPATGALTPQGCIENNDPFGTDSCTKDADGLNGVIDVAVSGDGLSVYAVASDAGTIVRFDRDPATGALKPKGCIEQSGGGEGCDASTVGIGNPVAVAISPDDASVYTVGSRGALSGVVQRFSRSTTSGKLTARDCVDWADGALIGCTTSAHGLASPTDVAVSPDSESIYAVSPNQKAVIHLRRRGKGGLTPKACTEDTGFGGDCNKTADGLDGAGSVAVSPDGASLYVGSVFDNALVTFDRNTAKGTISGDRCIDDAGPDPCAASSDFLSLPEDIALSPDGSSLYVASFFDNAVVRFSRKTGP